MQETWDVGSIPGLRQSSGGGYGNPTQPIPLQCSCQENSMDRGAWWATAHEVTNWWTWLRWLSIAKHSNSPLYTHTILSLSIRLLMGIWVASTFCLLWIMLLWKFVYKFLFGHMFSFLLGIVMHLTVFPPKTYVEGNLQHLRMWSHLEMSFYRGNHVKMRSLG